MKKSEVTPEEYKHHRSEASRKCYYKKLGLPVPQLLIKTSDLPPDDPRIKQRAANKKSYHKKKYGTEPPIPLTEEQKKIKEENRKLYKQKHYYKQKYGTESLPEGYVKKPYIREPRKKISKEEEENNSIFQLGIFKFLAAIVMKDEEIINILKELENIS